MSVVVRAETVLDACLSVLGLDREQWPLLICDACVYWEGLLAVGEEDLSHFGIFSTADPIEEAHRFIEQGYIKADISYKELQGFTRSLIQRYFVLGADAYGELIVLAEPDEEVFQYPYEEEED
jgi:hypothetical protein